MSEYFLDFVEWLRVLAPFWTYAVLLLIAYGENVIPPIPGDLAIVFAGYLVGIGHLNFFLVVLLCTIGGALGFMTMFFVGRKLGDAALDPNRLRWLPKQRIYRARLWLLKWGYALVGANRFLSGLRSVISLTVGAAMMNVWKTAAFATFSAFVWTALIVYLGSVVGENLDLVAALFRGYGRIVLGAILLAVVLRFVYWLLVQRPRRRADHDSPGINKPPR